MKALRIDFVNFNAWTDSTIVLAWLRGYPNQYKTFVGNRVAKIQDVCNSERWKHVPTKLNPADCASRGMFPNELAVHKIWWKGPDWLYQSEEYWPKLPEIPNAELEIKRINVHLCKKVIKSNLENLLEKFSSLNKFLRVTAYCFRFIKILKKELNNKEVLSRTETVEALNFWIKRAQAEEFNTALDRNTNQLTFDNEAIKDLNPFVDGQNIIRVGGRLQKVTLSFNSKHPIILPQHHQLTKLILQYAHNFTAHGSPQDMLNFLRQKYWVIRARQVIRNCVYRCVICFRQKAQKQQQLMGNLPAVRVRMSSPFLHFGVDFCGPFEIRTSKIRNAKIQKCYLAIFISLATRAIHIEVASDLTTQAFLAAMKRFVGRRGLITDMYFDNGTNFVGARNVITKDFENYTKRLKQELPDLTSQQNINWHFIPPASPHFGGIWETGVNSTKFHLRRIMGNSRLTFEELSTVVIQIEACLNSRPLYPLTDDVEDITALTPGHFLIGRPLLAIPEPSYLEQNEHSLRRWQYLQKLFQTFWKRWHIEYLHGLQQRTKWFSSTNNFKIGQLILIRDENIPPCKWLLGRIIDTHLGEDNLVRVVTIKTQDAVLKRTITKICLLPISDNDAKSHATE